MNKKALLAAGLAVVLCAGIFAACGKNEGTSLDDSKAADGSSSLSGSLTLTGSTSMAQVSNALAEAFRAKNKNVSISVGGNGSGEAPTAVDNGTAQIGLLSRALKDSENPGNYDTYKIALDGIAVIVNPKNEVKELTIEQIGKIYTGEITNWKDVGGKDAKIVVTGREAASGTRSAFEEIIKSGEKNLVDRCKLDSEYNSTGALKTTVVSNENAIGYVSLSSVDTTVHALSVEGVSPSEDTVQDGSYKVQRPFVMITKKGTTNELAKAFMNFINSDEGQKIIREDGSVPQKF